jgi:hypothetical protein
VSFACSCHFKNIFPPLTTEQKKIKAKKGKKINRKTINFSLFVA